MNDRWFRRPGAYVLVDGQFGSTGKGLAAGYLAEKYGQGTITHVTTNAGPNSGHTAYFVDKQFHGNKIVTKQIPVASVFLELLGTPVDTIINAGAIVDPEILNHEVKTWLRWAQTFVHPNAALIDDDMKAMDQATVGKIASTGKGIGPALARKIQRYHDGAVAKQEFMPYCPEGRSWDRFWHWEKDVVFVETAQGFSLGINSARFYPHTTSRECTVMQALADARIPAQMLRKVMAVYRTYPIRVGNTETGFSGEGYPDQQEVSWEAIGQAPERTTVTNRIRRVFTWSRVQFIESLAANMPDTILLNFCNYTKPEELKRLITDIYEDYFYVMGRVPEDILLGFGPESKDIITMEQWEKTL